MTKDAYRTTLTHLDSYAQLNKSAAEFWLALDTFVIDMKERAARAEDLQAWLVAQFGGGITPKPKVIPPNTTAEDGQGDDGQGDDEEVDLDKMIPPREETERDQKLTTGLWNSLKNVSHQVQNGDAEGYEAGENDEGKRRKRKVA